MKMKKLIGILLSIIMLSAALPASAEEPIKVLLDGAVLSFDVPPQIINSRTMVPMRGIFEAMGADVIWNPDDRSIRANANETSVEMQIQNPRMTVNGEDILLDVPPQIVDGRTLVPVRAVAESFDAYVFWNAESRTVIILTMSVLLDNTATDKVFYITSFDSGRTAPSTPPALSFSLSEILDAGSSSPSRSDVHATEVTVPDADEYIKNPEPEEEEEVFYPAEVSEDDAYEAMLALKQDYPEGMPWTNDDYYKWEGGIYSGGYGCAGFAFALSDAAFGNRPAKKITENISIDMLKVGDILRINGDTHSVVVLEIYEDYIVIAEGNYNHSIHWGRELTADRVLDATYVLTRY